VCSSDLGAGRIDAYEAYLLALSMIPVELTSFTASATENSVTLNWSTATETNNSGFSIERKTPMDEIWREVGFVPGFGTTTETMNYTFTDEKLSMGLYSYRLKQVDFDGTFEYTNSVEAEVYSPFEFKLAQNYPNPFNPSTKISFSIPAPEFVTLKVYDILGTEVATLINERKEPGVYTINFNASQLASGMYLYRLQAGSYIETRKMVLMR